jgi:hypothetical protein
VTLLPAAAAEEFMTADAGADWRRGSPAKWNWARKSP